MARKLTAREKRIKNREKWLKARNAEDAYVRRLRQVAKHIQDIVMGFGPEWMQNEAALTSSLRRYAELLRPWARAVGAAMIADVARRDRRAWREHSRQIGMALRAELESTPSGPALRQRLDEQVTLITSLPIEAAQRVHKLTVEGLMGSRRAADVAKDIKRSGQVSASRAMLIARTEIARTAATLTMERAKLLGSEGYVWQTAKDTDVRHAHKQMQGKFVRWDTPPTLSDGTTTHAGMIYNCRCYPEPVLPDQV